MRLTSVFHLAAEKAPLLRAYARLNRRASPGVDGEAWDAWEGSAGAEVHALSRELLEGSYFPRPLREVRLEKPDGGERVIRVPCLRDKVAQWSFASLISSVYASRHAERGVSMIEAGEGAIFPPWVARCRVALRFDIKGCFDEIRGHRLQRVLSRVIADKRLLRVVALWSADGLPQGLPVSPALCSVFLHTAFDGWAMEQRRAGVCMNVARYVDDVVVGLKTEAEAYAFALRASRQLEQHGLRLNIAKTVVSSGSSACFLGLKAVDGAIAPERDVSCASYRHYRVMGVPRSKLRPRR